MELKGARTWIRPAGLGVLIVLAMLFGAIIATRAGGKAPASTATAAASSQSAGGRQVPVAANTAISNLPDLVDRVKPSVVAINTVVTSRTGQRQGQGLGTGIVALAFLTLSIALGIATRSGPRPNANPV